MLKYRNFGKKSLNEIKEKLSALGLALGMNIDPALLDAAPQPAEIRNSNPSFPCAISAQQKSSAAGATISTRCSPISLAA